MSITYSPSISTLGLVLNLDAANPRSYPGTGTKWYDLSGQNNHFDIVATAYNSSGPKYMDFGGSYGCAKKVDADMSVSGDVTCICWTRVLNSTAQWRTLLRGLSSGNDHQVIIQTGAWGIGMYDNVNASWYNDAGYSQQSIPGYGTSAWNMLIWRWHDVATPYYNFSYNDTPGTIRGSISGINARFKHGFCSIGAYNNGVQTTPATCSQPWGDISNIALYNRYLSDAECLVNFQAHRGRYGV